MATSPRLKYPFVAGIGMTVYLVTTNVTAAKMAAAASSRVLITCPSLVLDFAPKAKDARTRASWGQSGADPPQPSPHTDLPRSSRQNGAAIRNLCLPTLKGLTVDPGIPPGHGLCPERSRQNAERNDVCYLPTAFCLLARASRAVTADRESPVPTRQSHGTELLNLTGELERGHPAP